MRRDLGFIKFFGVGGILAAFTEGVAFKLPTEEEEDEKEEGPQGALERLFEIPIFVNFGMMLP